MSNGGNGWKWMEVGHPYATYTDITGHITVHVITNQDGWGEFFCPAGKVSVWVPGAQ